MSYVQIYYHIVFSTKNRELTLCEKHQNKLYNYLWGILKNKHCHLYRIGGIDDHIHMLLSLHPTLALSDLIRDLKTSSNRWIKEQGLFPHFDGWQNEYGAFTKSHKDRDKIIDYIKEQKSHHVRESSTDEFKRLLKQDHIDFKEKYVN